MKRISKDIIFDMDGVIFDTENLFLDCWRQLATVHGLADIDTVYHRVIGLKADDTRQIYLDAYGPDFDYEQLNQKASALFYEKAAAGMPMKPGVRELLESLKSWGYCIGLASSTRSQLVLSQLGGCDLLKYFTVIIGGDMVEQGKPAPDIYLMACARLGANPGETYAVEDSYNGVRAAHAAGMQVIMVPDIVLPDAKMRSISTHIFPDLLAVRAYLAKEGEIH